MGIEFFPPAQLAPLSSKSFLIWGLGECYYILAGSWGLPLPGALQVHQRGLGQLLQTGLNLPGLNLTPLRLATSPGRTGSWCSGLGHTVSPLKT